MALPENPVGLDILVEQITNSTEKIPCVLANSLHSDSEPPCKGRQHLLHRRGIPIIQSLEDLHRAPVEFEGLVGTYQKQTVRAANEHRRPGRGDEFIDECHGRIPILGHIPVNSRGMYGYSSKERSQFVQIVKDMVGPPMNLIRKIADQTDQTASGIPSGGEIVKRISCDHDLFRQDTDPPGTFNNRSTGGFVQPAFPGQDDIEGP